MFFHKSVGKPFQSIMSVESWPGLFLISNGGTDFTVCKDLIGKYLNDFSSSGDDYYVACRDGCFRVNSNSFSCSEVTKEQFISITSGSDFAVAIQSKPNYSLYSWGENADCGQIGQGITRTTVMIPTKINYEAKFRTISSGEKFCICTDENGQLYAFGEVNTALR